DSYYALYDSDSVDSGLTLLKCALSIYDPELVSIAISNVKYNKWARAHIPIFMRDLFEHIPQKMEQFAPNVSFCKEMEPFAPNVSFRKEMEPFIPNVSFRKEMEPFLSNVSFHKEMEHESEDNIELKVAHMVKCI